MTRSVEASLPLLQELSHLPTTLDLTQGLIIHIITILMFNKMTIVNTPISIVSSMFKMFIT